MKVTSQLKKNLISRIKNSDDLNFLNAIQTLFDSADKALYPLSLEQQSAIEKGRSDIKNGHSFKNEEVISEMKQWLKNK